MIWITISSLYLHRKMNVVWIDRNFFLDLSKLSFAGVVLVKMAYIRPEDDLITTIMAIISGGLLTALFLMIGLLVLKL